MMRDQWLTSYCIRNRTLIVSFPHARPVVSSAVYGGGFRNARHILNHQVVIDRSYEKTDPVIRWEDPRRTLKRLALDLGLAGSCVGLMTAVDLRQVVLMRHVSSKFWVEGFFTVGVTNAVRAGEKVQEDPGLRDHHAQAGTINMILITNAPLTRSAMIGAVGVATESKTAALFDLNISSPSGNMATGTGTDSIVLVSARSAPRLNYAGTHTKIGELIGKVVECGVHDGLQTFLNSSRKTYARCPKKL